MGFRNRSLRASQQNISFQRHNNRTHNSATIIKGDLSEPLKNLLSLLLSKNPMDRPSTEEILRHEWVLRNLPKNDLSFLQHPAFRNSHQIADLLKYSQYVDLSPKGKASGDVRKRPFFGKVNSKHEIFIAKNQEEINLKFPNIFHDRRFDHSYSQKSLNRSVNRSFENQQQTATTRNLSPFKQNKIFDPMRQPFQNSRLEDEEYDIVQHVPQRQSFGNQEEQRFSTPVEVEKRKKNENNKMSVFADNQKLYKSNDFHERNTKTPQYSAGLVDNGNIRQTFNNGRIDHSAGLSNKNNLNNSQNTNQRKFPESSTGLNNNYNRISNNNHNQFDQGNNDSGHDNRNNNSGFGNKSNNNSRLLTKKEDNNNNFMIGDLSKTNQNDYSGYSGRSNNKNLYFDNKNLY